LSPPPTLFPPPPVLLYSRLGDPQLGALATTLKNRPSSGAISSLFFAIFGIPEPFMCSAPTLDFSGRRSLTFQASSPPVPPLIETGPFGFMLFPSSIFQSLFPGSLWTAIIATSVVVPPPLAVAIFFNWIPPLPPHLLGRDRSSLAFLWVTP